VDQAGPQETTTLIPTNTPTVLPTPTLVPTTDARIDLSSFDVTGSIVFGLAVRRAHKVDNLGVFSLNLKDQNLVRVAEYGYDLQAVSLDGTQILVNKGNELHLTSLDGTGGQLLTDKYYSFGGKGAYWMPGGTSIIVLILEEGETNRIYLLNTSDASLTQIPLEGGNPIELHPSPDNTMIYWEAGDCSSPADCQREGVWVTDLGNLKSEVLPGVVFPAFSADGSQIAYHAPGEDKNVPVIAPLDGGGGRGIELPGDNLLDYVWSPASDRLAVLTLIRSSYSGRSSDVRIFLINPYNWVTQEFEPTTGLNSSVLWSPDGKNLLTTGTFQDDEGGYQLTFRLLNLENKKVAQLDGILNVIDPDFLLTTNVFWVTHNY